MIPVTKPFLPEKKDYKRYVDSIWERQWLTNHGPLVNELESALKQILNIPNLLFVSNGTIALQVAIKALNLKGNIITTPFSYVATTSSICWEQCNPVFVDIDKETFNIDVEKIEAEIDEHTSAILATHVFGNPCEIDKIDKIAKKHSLKVIYDAAHCFGTKYKNNSVFEYGDISTVSFHATKLFHTVEGGAVICNDPEKHEKAALLRNFGHTSAVTFDGIGINGKNSEFHAAMGLCCLESINEILAKRKEQWLRYRENLSSISSLRLLKINSNAEFNYAYFPIVFDSQLSLDKAEKILNLNYIQPRRYFYPSLNTLNYVNPKECPVSEAVSSRVLCLPLFHSLKKEDQDLICNLIVRSLG